MGAKIIWCEKKEEGGFKRVGNSTFNEAKPDDIGRLYFPFFNPGDQCSVTLDDLTDSSAVFYRGAQALSNCRVMSQNAIDGLRKFSENLASGTVIIDPETRFDMWVSGGAGSNSFDGSKVVQVKCLPPDVDPGIGEYVVESHPVAVSLVTDEFLSASSRVASQVSGLSGLSRSRIENSLCIASVDHVVHRSLQPSFSFVWYTSEMKFKFNVQCINGRYSLQKREQPLGIEDVVLFDDRNVMHSNRRIGDGFVILYDDDPVHGYIYQKSGAGGRTIVPSADYEQYKEFFKDVLQRYFSRDCRDITTITNGFEYDFSNAGTPLKLQIFSLDDRYHKERGD